MNYRHIYMCIVMHAKSEMELGLRPKSYYYKSKNFSDQYFEFHHILPRSLYPYWIKRKSNIVSLTAREHFFCHQLLTKIYPNSFEMKSAVWRMASSGRLKISSRDYERAKIIFAVAASTKKKGIQTKATLGKHWFSNGVVSVLATECPEGFYRGRGKRNNWYLRKYQGRLYTNGEIEIRSFKKPKGFRQGSLKSFYSKSSAYYECKETGEIKRSFEWMRSIGISASMIKQCNDRGWAYKGKHFKLVKVN